MLEIVRSLVQRHLAVGGHCLLMSATLGEVLRAELEHRPRLPLAEARVAPYPVANSLPVAVNTVRSALRLADYKTAMDDVVACVRGGHCALVIRSTVYTARETYQELLSAGVPALLHHAHYADLDRQYLDARLVGVIARAAPGPRSLSSPLRRPSSRWTSTPICWSPTRHPRTCSCSGADGWGGTDQSKCFRWW
jgi:hypothetical protein